MAGLKTERAIRDELSRRLARTYLTDLCYGEDSWPFTLSLGRPTKAQILEGFSTLDALVATLRNWEQLGLARVEYAMREAGGPKRLPSHLEIPSQQAAAKLASPRGGEPWRKILQRASARRSQLLDCIPGLEPDVHIDVLRKTDAQDDLEFELLLAAGSWFRTHDAHGLMPREVPLPGIDSKWLNAKQRQKLLCALASKDTLGLRERPPALEFAYLDSAHLAGGGRRYDSWVVENKDTYLNLPQLSGGICIFGSGRAGQALVGELTWIREAKRILYWGDLDADGFEILNGYRAHGLSCESMLMDRRTLERFGRYGTSVEKDHKTPLVRERKELPHLNAEELSTYELLTDPAYQGHRRLEQEKIPLSEALAVLA
ncbi:MAG: DUF2220 family protein [Coriobacteriales bacterium]|nr:DUF2220 family protein [Coriobacteriales bacterium]